MSLVEWNRGLNGIKQSSKIYWVATKRETHPKLNTLRETQETRGY